MSLELLNPQIYKVYFALIHSDKQHRTPPLSFLNDLAEPKIHIS